MPEAISSADKSNATDAPSELLANWQFSLRGLLWLTLGAALVSLLFTLYGLGGLPLGIGLLVMVCNWRGALAPLQGDRRGRMIKLSLGFLAISLMLPAVRTCNNDYAVGWQAGYLNAGLQSELPPSFNDFAGYGAITSLNLLNLLLIASPLWLRRLAKGKGHVYGAMLGCTAVVAWRLPLGNSENFYVGYYCWAASTLFALCAWRLGTRTLAAMLLQAAAWLYFFAFCKLNFDLYVHELQVGPPVTPPTVKAPANSAE